MSYSSRNDMIREENNLKIFNPMAPLGNRKPPLPVSPQNLSKQSLSLFLLP